MKTFKLCLVTILLCSLSAGISLAQGNKKVDKNTYPSEGFIPCTNDYVVGEETIVYTYWDEKVQIRGKGTFTGESGKIYTWRMLQNFNIKEYREKAANNGTWIINSIIECDGVPVAFLKSMHHTTINANGELTVEFERGAYQFICL